MIAIERHISTKLVLALDAGQVNGKKATKRVTISGLREGVSADAIGELVRALEKLLEYPVDTIKIHTVSAIERVAENEEDDRENAAEAAGAETTGTADSRVNDDAADTKDARPDGHAVTRAFGGVYKNGPLGRSYNAAYLKEPRLPVCRLDDYACNSYMLSSSTHTVACVGVASQYQTPQGYTRPPP